MELATFCAGIERLLGRHDEAHARLRASLDQMPDPAAPDAIALMIELAVDALFRAQPEAVREWARRALAAARELDDGPLIVSAASMLTLGHAVAGDIAEAEEAYAEAATLVAGLSDAALGTRVGAAAYLCSAATFLDRYDEACAHGERALRAGRAAGHLHPTLLPALGAAHLMRGRLAEAAKVLDAGVEAATAGRHHPGPGVDAAQPLVALDRLRRRARSARSGRGGAGAHRPARREHPDVLGGDVRGPRGGIQRRRPARRRRPRP